MTASRLRLVHNCSEAEYRQARRDGYLHRPFTAPPAAPEPTPPVIEPPRRNTVLALALTIAMEAAVLACLMAGAYFAPVILRAVAEVWL